MIFTVPDALTMETQKIQRKIVGIISITNGWHWCWFFRLDASISPSEG